MPDLGIIDTHLHFFSRGVFAFFASQIPDLAAASDPALAAAARLGIEPPPEAPESLAEKWVTELDRYHVRRAVLFGSAPGEQETVARAVRAYPDRFVAYQMLNPRAPNAPAALQQIVAKGLRGVLLFPAMHEYFPDDPACRPVYEAARIHRLVVFVHVGYLRIAIREKLGLPGSFDERFGDPVRLTNIAREFSEVSFVVPHFGCGLLKALLSAAKGIRNLYLDTSSSNEWMRRTPEFPDLKVVFQAVLDAKTFGADRILFGSDSTIFPRGWRRDVYEAQRAAIDTLGLSAAEVNAVFRDNAARLLG